MSKAKKGYVVQIEIQHLQDGEPPPSTWATQDAILRKLAMQLSESPAIEYVRVTLNGMQELVTLAPRNTKTLAEALSGRAPRLAALLLEHDSSLADEVRMLLSGEDKG